MPDNSALITKLEAILQVGAERVVIDGQAVTFDFAEVRKQLNEARRTDTATLASGVARPRFFRQIFTNTRGVS